MVFFVFLVMFLSPLLLAQEASSVPKSTESFQSETASPSPTAPTVVPSSGAKTLQGGETNAPAPSGGPTSPSGTDIVTPVDPSAEGAPEATPPPTASEEAAAIETNAPISDQAEEPLKVPSEKPSESTEKKEEQIKIRYYQVRTQVEHDPEVAALKQQAITAVSEEKRRQALRAYYELLFKKMKSIDTSISNRCDVMQAAYLRRLEQVSLEPTIPLTPFVNPSAAAEKKETTPVPTSNTPKKKKHQS